MHIFTVLPLKLKQPSEYLMSKSLWSIYLVAFFLSLGCMQSLRIGARVSGKSLGSIPPESN